MTPSRGVRTVFHQNGTITFYSTIMKMWFHKVAPGSITEAHLATFSQHDWDRARMRAEEQKNRAHTYRTRQHRKAPPATDTVVGG